MALTKRERKEFLKERFRELGVTHDVIARDVGYARPTVTLVLNDKTQLLGKSTVKKIRAAVAERAGVEYGFLWAA